MTIQQHSDARSFLAQALPFLEQWEASNNLPIGLALAASDQATDPSDALWLTIQLDTTCVGTCLQTPGRHLTLSIQPDFRTAAILRLADWLQQHHWSVTGVNGARVTSVGFANHWEFYQNCQAVVVMELGVYQLDRVLAVRLAAGQLRPAGPEDRSILSEWIQGFNADVFTPISPEEALKTATQKIDARELFVWETDRLVTMAGSARRTPNGVCINYVYTPPEFRQQGYATSCVAVLSQQLLAQYRFCTLFTDLANPTSNKIYQRIGYRKVDEWCDYRFQEHSFGDDD